MAVVPLVITLAVGVRCEIFIVVDVMSSTVWFVYLSLIAYFYVKAVISQFENGTERESALFMFWLKGNLKVRLLIRLSGQQFSLVSQVCVSSSFISFTELHHFPAKFLS